MPSEFEEDEAVNDKAAKPTTEPFDVDKYRERIRARVALALAGTLLMVVLLTFGYIFFGPIEPGDSRALIGQVNTAIVGLVGAATGFYYGGGKK